MFFNQHPADYLLDILPTQSNNQTTSPTTQTPSQTQDIPNQTNSLSFSIGAGFVAEFGREETMQQLCDLESQRSQLVQPQLKLIHSKIKCSTLSQHVWFHCQSIRFEKKEYLLKWCREKKVEIIHKGSVISPMETVGLKDCNLCMQEMIKLFYDFGDSGG